MKKIIKTLEWKFDYHIVHFFYSKKNMERYIDYMYEKYPGKFEESLNKNTKDIYN